MKKFKCILVISLALTFGVVQTSCIGSFAAFNKVLKWNNGVGGKWVNELVFLILWILPVYEICFFFDGIILNTIEFWTGSNPLAMNSGEFDVKTIEKDGKVYEVTASQNRMDFIQLEGPIAGQKCAFVFDTGTQTWGFEK